MRIKRCRKGRFTAPLVFTVVSATWGVPRLYFDPSRPKPVGKGLNDRHTGIRPVNGRDSESKERTFHSPCTRGRNVPTHTTPTRTFGVSHTCPSSRGYVHGAVIVVHQGQIQDE